MLLVHKELRIVQHQMLQHNVTQVTYSQMDNVLLVELAQQHVVQLWFQVYVLLDIIYLELLVFLVQQVLLFVHYLVQL